MMIGSQHTSSTKLRKVVNLLEAEHDAIEALSRLMRLLDDEKTTGRVLREGLISAESLETV